MSDQTTTVPTDNDEEETKPLNAGDDFSEDSQNDNVNSDDAPLDAGVDQNYDDTEDDTITPDDATDNPLATESGLAEVDNKVLPEDQENLGDVYNPLEDDEDSEGE